MFILDIGSGNTLTSIDTTCSIISIVQNLKIPNSFVKFRLFKEAGNNIPLNLEVFERATKFCHIVGMPYGVSIFDEESLNIALYSGALRFIKIANDSDLHYLIEKVPDVDHVIVSTDNLNYKIDRPKTDIIYCVSKYPAQEKDYEKFGDKLKKGMSDHTTSWNLFKKYQPKIYECHFCLEDSKGLDAGRFARRPKDFKEILDIHSDQGILKEVYENSMHDSGEIGIKKNTE